jgi:hypothetical protein
MLNFWSPCWRENRRGNKRCLQSEALLVPMPNACVPECHCARTLNTALAIRDLPSIGMAITCLQQLAESNKKLAPIFSFYKLPVPAVAWKMLMVLSLRRVKGGICSGCPAMPSANDDWSLGRAAAMRWRNTVCKSCSNHDFCPVLPSTSVQGWLVWAVGCSFPCNHDMHTDSTFQVMHAQLFCISQLCAC